MIYFVVVLNHQNMILCDDF